MRRFLIYLNYNYLYYSIYSIYYKIEIFNKNEIFKKYFSHKK